MTSASTPADAKPPERSRRMDMFNVALVAGLLVACLGLNYAVDPFGLNRSVDLGLDKAAVSHKLSYFNWKLAGYLNDPRPVVLLGDSRVDSWPTAAFEKELGQPTANMAFGGGSTTEAIDAFWFATNQGQLKQVYLGLNLSTLNGAINMCRSCDTRSMMDSPLRYYLSPLVTKATWLNLWHAFTADGATSERPPMHADAFWQHQLDQWGRITGETFREPELLLESLRKVAAWCTEHEVALTFVLCPTHRDISTYAQKYKLTATYARLKTELAAIAPTLDMDWENELTRDKTAFSDPSHVVGARLDEVATQVAKGVGPLVKKLSP